MTKSQLNAISRSYTEKRRKAALEAAESNGVDLIFKYQSVFKTLAGFVMAKDEKKAEKAYKQARAAIIERKAALETSGCNSYKYTEVLKALEQVDNKLAK